MGKGKCSQFREFLNKDKSKLACVSYVVEEPEVWKSDDKSDEVYLHTSTLSITDCRRTVTLEFDSKRDLEKLTLLRKAIERFQYDFKNALAEKKAIKERIAKDGEKEPSNKDKS